MSKNKVTIAIPNLGHIHVYLMNWLFKRLITPSEHYEEIGYIAPKGIVPHDAARNWCVKRFLESDATHLFFLDSDVIPPQDALDKLMAADVPAISGLYANMSFDKKRQQTFKQYTVFRRVKDDTGEYDYRLTTVNGEGVQPIDRCGGGCLLIKREVFEKVGLPAFKFNYTEEGIIAYGEDIDFGAKLEQAGIQLYAHFDVICQHGKEVLL